VGRADRQEELSCLTTVLEFDPGAGDILFRFSLGLEMRFGWKRFRPDLLLAA
jgi:hypothetical protein